VSFAGLDNLEKIDGNLSINFNPSLTSLAAIASLTNDDIGGSVLILDNNFDCAAQDLQFTVNVSCD
jgi:hypothetical protein